MMIANTPGQSEPVIFAGMVLIDRSSETYKTHTHAELESMALQSKEKESKE